MILMESNRREQLKENLSEWSEDCWKKSFYQVDKVFGHQPGNNATCCFRILQMLKTLLLEIKEYFARLLKTPSNINTDFFSDWDDNIHIVMVCMEIYWAKIILKFCKPMCIDLILLKWLMIKINIEGVWSWCYW